MVLKDCHKFCRNNKDELATSKRCGCFYCGRIFDPKSITKWSHDTAICPHCGIDSILPESKVYLTDEFLSKMYKFWFETPSNAHEELSVDSSEVILMSNNYAIYAQISVFLSYYGETLASTKTIKTFDFGPNSKSYYNQ